MTDLNKKIEALQTRLEGKELKLRNKLEQVNEWIPRVDFSGLNDETMRVIEASQSMKYHLMATLEVIDEIERTASELNTIEQVAKATK